MSRQTDRRGADKQTNKIGKMRKSEKQKKKKQRKRGNKLNKYKRKWTKREREIEREVARGHQS